MIVGRKTFLSVGERPLPGRPHIIISRNPDYRPDGVEVVSSLEEALSRAKSKARELGVEAVYVAGGGEIYRQAIPFADQLSVTHVEVELDGDTFFSGNRSGRFLRKPTKLPCQPGKKTITPCVSQPISATVRQSELFGSIWY